MDFQKTYSFRLEKFFARHTSPYAIEKGSEGRIESGIEFLDMIGIHAREAGRVPVFFKEITPWVLGRISKMLILLVVNVKSPIFATKTFEIVTRNIVMIL
jgi:hypothetical protein